MYFDPELNSLFHAFDALGHRCGHKFWKDDRDGMPLGYKGGFQFVPYREIAPPPSDETAALTLIRSVIERHVGRLNDLLAEHEEIEADEADGGTTARRSIAARHSSGTGGTSRPGTGSCCKRSKPFEKCGRRNSERGMGKAKRRMANVRWRMTEGRWRMTEGG